MSPFLEKAVTIVEANPITFFVLRAMRRVKSIYRLLFSNQSILRKTGWIKSTSKLRSINEEGESLPWISYSAIHFLNASVPRDVSVFEYGSGNSTEWWSKRVKNVTSVEHNKDWYERVNKNIGNNVNYIFQQLNDSDDYESSVIRSTEKYQIIVIDGRRRVKCIKESVNALSNDGVIILDNSDRLRYKEGVDFLINLGFKRIEFYGLISIGIHPVGTSVFYKNDNILSI